MPRRRSSSVDEGYDFVSWTRMKANIRRFCANKFWCKAKLFASFIVVLDVLVTAWKWAYLQTRPEAYRLAIHVAEKVLYPYWFATLIVDGLYIYYGIMDEYVWAMKMYVFNNIVHVILLDILLLVELIVILEYGHEAPWTHLSVSMTTLQMVLITLWHPFAIYMARRIELGIYASINGYPNKYVKLLLICQKLGGKDFAGTLERPGYFACLNNAYSLYVVQNHEELMEWMLKPMLNSFGTQQTERQLSSKYTIGFVDKQLRKALQWDKGSGCKIPYLDPFSNDTTWIYEKLLPIIMCNGQDWVRCYHSKCSVVDEVRKTVKNIACKYEDILFEDDFHHSLGKATIAKDGDYRLVASDYVSVSCIGVKASSGKIVKWSGNVAGFRPVSVSPVPGQRPDVVIFAFDSTPRSGFIRLMPKSWKVLTQELNATVMEGYNILGDGTPSALFPILTGKTELELPDVRWSNANNRTMDDFPFIFKKLKEEGYRTAYLEDMPVNGAFQFRFTGFKQQPTDHYMRAFRATHSHLFKQWQFCVGDTPQFKMMMIITEQFLELEGKRFIFTFINDITHEDFNFIQLADDDTAAFLRRLMKRREDTLIVVMGDHGPRYAAARREHSIRGKLDERLPLLAIRLPDRLTRTRPHALSALEANARVLTTPHDLHATLLDALDMRRHWNPYKVEGADFKRGLTMIEPIPSNRSCSEAGVETHWCTCLVWENVSVSDPLYGKTGKALIDYINWILKDVGSQCVPRTIAATSWVLRQRPNSRLLSFNTAINLETYLAYFNVSTIMTYENYQIGIEASPGGAVYEAYLIYNVKQDKFVIQTRDISRVNSYRGESDCILASRPDLAPYCFCMLDYAAN